MKAPATAAVQPSHGNFFPTTAQMFLIDQLKKLNRELVLKKCIDACKRSRSRGKVLTSAISLPSRLVMPGTRYAPAGAMRLYRKINHACRSELRNTDRGDGQTMLWHSNMHLSMYITRDRVSYAAVLIAETSRVGIHWAAHVAQRHIISKRSLSRH